MEDSQGFPIFKISYPVRIPEQKHLGRTPHVLMRQQLAQAIVGYLRLYSCGKPCVVEEITSVGNVTVSGEFNFRSVAEELLRELITLRWVEFEGFGEGDVDSDDS